MLFGNKLCEEKEANLSALISIETIFKNFYDKSNSYSTKNPEYLPIENDVLQYFKRLINPKSHPANPSLEVLSDLSPRHQIYLYKSALNSQFTSIQLIEPTQEALQSFLSLDDLKSAYFRAKNPEEILCILLPENYHMNYLNIFDTTLTIDNFFWLITGVILNRGNLCVSITRDLGKKQWKLSFAYNSKSQLELFPSLSSAISSAACKGFVPLAYFYIKDIEKIDSEIFPIKIIDILIRMRVEGKNSKKKKTKSLQSVVLNRKIQEYLSLNYTHFQYTKPRRESLVALLETPKDFIIDKKPAAPRSARPIPEQRKSNIVLSNTNFPNKPVNQLATSAIMFAPDTSQQRSNLPTNISFADLLSNPLIPAIKNENINEIKREIVPVPSFMSNKADFESEVSIRVKPAGMKRDKKNEEKGKDYGLLQNNNLSASYVTFNESQASQFEETNKSCSKCGYMFYEDNTCPCDYKQCLSCQAYNYIHAEICYNCRNLLIRH